MKLSLQREREGGSRRMSERPSVAAEGREGFFPSPQSRILNTLGAERRSLRQVTSLGEPHTTEIQLDGWVWIGGKPVLTNLQTGDNNNSNDFYCSSTLLKALYTHVLKPMDARSKKCGTPKYFRLVFPRRTVSLQASLST